MATGLLESRPLTAGEKIFRDLIADRCPTFKNEAEECHKRFVRGYWEAVKKDGPEGGHVPSQVSDSGPDRKNLDEAIEDYSGTVTWREEEAVDSLRSMTLPQEDDYNANWPCHIYGTDSHGHILVVERTQEIDPGKLKEKMPLELCLKHRARFMECLMAEKAAESEARGHTIYKHIHVLDLGGFGSKHYSNLAMLKPIIGMGGSRYPETL
jgi:hypothetical protein